MVSNLNYELIHSVDSYITKGLEQRILVKVFIETLVEQSSETSQASTKANLASNNSP
jgi:hypothetical protein